MRDVADFGAFNETWSQFFPRAKPATTLVPTATPGFFLSDARIEINTIALRDGGRTRKEVVEAGVFPAFAGYSEAVKAGDLLLLSGLLAIDEDGVIAADRSRPGRSSVEVQMHAMLENAQKICRAAGTSLANVVRIQQYHTDLAEFDVACRVWEEHLPAQPLPLSAMRVPFLPVPGCTVQLDLWVYAP
jgi:enamine deaminase RidA (YjgF/YER057c/UK114 family)